jgi:hypothetical protein
MTKPRLPTKIINRPFDTSFEFAEANFRGWWFRMKDIYGYSEIDLIDYVTDLRNTLCPEETTHSEIR